MTCFCCNQIVDVAKKVKIRRLITFDPSRGGPDSPEYMAYVEECTYRWGVVCIPCYRNLDSPDGTYLVEEKVFNIAFSSRHDKAPSISKDKYEQWQRKEASKLGLD